MGMKRDFDIGGCRSSVDETARLEHAKLIRKRLIGLEEADLPDGVSKLLLEAAKPLGDVIANRPNLLYDNPYSVMEWYYNSLMRLMHKKGEEERPYTVDQFQEVLDSLPMLATLPQMEWPEGFAEAVHRWHEEKAHEYVATYRNWHWLYEETHQEPTQQEGH